jgi:alpha-N-acetylglucosamine transferase
LFVTPLKTTWDVRITWAWSRDQSGLAFLDMARQRSLSDLPEFLQSSPFLPVCNISDSFTTAQASQPKPTLAQIIRSKRFRTIIIFAFFVLALLFLPGKLQAYHPLIRTGLSGPKCYFSPPITIPEIPEEVDWTEFAYSQYATTTDYLCNSLMIFETLHRLGSKADRILLYTSTLLTSTENKIVGYLLEKAQTEFNVKLIPIEEQRKSNVIRIWASSYTKLLAFNQTQYSRIIHLDSDSTLLSSLDELFFLPPAPVVVPKAYWLPTPKLSSHIMLLTPSSKTFAKIQEEIEKATKGIYDMEIINSLFGSTCSILPHQAYALLTGELRSPDPEHKAFFDPATMKWDPDQVMKEAKFVHFSDYPFPKPWQETSAEEQERAAPECVVDDQEGDLDCRAQNNWIGLYKDFKARRKVYSAVHFVAF